MPVPGQPPEGPSADYYVSVVVFALLAGSYLLWDANRYRHQPYRHTTLVGLGFFVAGAALLPYDIGMVIGFVGILVAGVGLGWSKYWRSTGPDRAFDIRRTWIASLLRRIGAKLMRAQEWFRRRR